MRSLSTAVLGISLLLAESPAFAQSRSSTAHATGPIVTVTIGHPYVSSVAIAPNGHWMVSGGGDNVARIWDVASGRLLRSLKGHPTFLYGVAISPDGRKIASLDADHFIKIWDPGTGQELRTIKGDGLGRIRFSKDGASLYAQGLNVLRRFDVASGAIRQTYTPAKLPNYQSYLPNALAVSADESLIATSRICNPSYNDTLCLITIWDARSGRLLRSWKADNQVIALEFSPDGRWLASGGYAAHVDMWDASTGQHVRRFETDPSYTRSMAFSPDSRVMFSGNEFLRAFDTTSGREVWKVKSESGSNTVLYDKSLQMVVAAGGHFSFRAPDTGKEHRAVKGPGSSNSNASIVILPDGNWLVSASGKLSVWDAATARPAKTLGEETGRIASISNTADGRSPVLAIQGYAARIWDISSDNPPIEITVADKDKKQHLKEASLSSDGRWLATAIYDLNTVAIWDVATGKVARTIPAHKKHLQAVALSPDGRTLASAGWDEKELKFWDVTSGALLRSHSNSQYDTVDRLSYSADGKFLFSADSDISNEAFRIRDAQTGRPMRVFKHGYNIDGYAASPDGRFFATAGGLSNATRLWDATNGRMLFEWKGDFGSMQSVTFSKDSRQVIAITSDGAVVVWSTQTGAQLAMTVQSSSDEWVTITQEGFFAASENGAALLHVVRGFEIVGIDQFYQSLYRPDLVREKLAGDPRGLVREAASKLDLNKVLASGNAPSLALVGLRDGERVASQQIETALDVTVREGGLGRVEWRVNGVTVGIDEPAAPAAGQPLRLTRGLALEEGENEIEVVAYNAQNLVASVPVRATVTAQAAAAAAAPRLFLLAVGLNEYEDKEIRLKFAVPDATALAEALGKAGQGVYQSVQVTLLKDAEVRRENLDATFRKLAQEVRPSDVFVFFIAGHGKTVDGRYYFIPQDIKLDGIGSVVQQGIAQEQWQRWFASVPARKSVLLFDTCESGSLAGEGLETRALERGAASDRLVQATGRAILTATSDTADAFEGYRGHGLFTYNLLDALGSADSDGNGTVELSELAAFVHAQVTALSEKVFQKRQVPQVRVTGNYPIAKSMRVLADGPSDLIIASKPTHMISASADLLIQPVNGARRVRKLEAKTPLTLVRSEGGWTLVAREGKPVGYVATRDLSPLQ